MNCQPHVFWLFGLSGAGKSTLAAALRRDLSNTLDATPLMLDGDRLRNGLSRGLGFSEADRAENLRRAAEVARLGVESDQVVIAAFITPREENRRMIEQVVGADLVSLIHVDASLDICQRRDAKGLYARAVAGTLPQMTGVSASFDVPSRFALRLETGVESPEISAEKLWKFARKRLDGPEARQAAVV